MKTVVIGEPQDSIAILLIVARNAVSARCRNIAPSGRSGAMRMAAPEARALRDDESMTVPAHE